MPEQNENVDNTQIVTVFANGESHHEQRYQFRDDHYREYLESQRFSEAAFVGEHLGHNAQTRQSKYPGHGQSVCESQTEPEI